MPKRAGGHRGRREGQKGWAGCSETSHQTGIADILQVAFHCSIPRQTFDFPDRIERTQIFSFSRLARLPCVQNVRFSWFLAGRSLARGADFRKNLSADNQCEVMKQRIKRISFQLRIARIARIILPPFWRPMSFRRKIRIWRLRTSQLSADKKLFVGGSV